MFYIETFAYASSIFHLVAIGFERYVLINFGLMPRRGKIPFGEIYNITRSTKLTIMPILTSEALLRENKRIQ